ncbi:lytic murein transglycosylase, partial [Pseudomonas aeruginosa]
MRNPERSALLKVSGLLGSTVVAMGLGLSSACAQKNPIIEYNQPSAPLQTKAPFTGAGPAASVSAGAPSEAQPGQSFEQWRDAFRQQALAGGIDAQTFDRAFAGVEPDPAVVEADRSQPEFTRPVWKYLEGALDPLRVRQGQARLAQHARILGEVDARYAVDADAVVAIWGMESNYGSHMGNKNVIRSLATLAYEGRRPEFAHAQLLAALKILQHGDVPASFMIGSWAGAMGQTQFIPTTYNQYAVDFDGDGKRDIWGSPGDALASTANYLKASGWIAGQPWGFEVRLPAGFDYSLAELTIRKPLGEWQGMGVQGVNGGPLPSGLSGEQASLLLPAGHRGPAFLVLHNFRAILKYNNS